MADPKVTTIHLEGSGDTEFFLIHGYTGSPTDFGDLPYELHRTFDASVTAPLLPGHATSLGDLLTQALDDLIAPVEEQLAQRIAAGKRVILIGFSFGAQLALYFASKYPVESIVLVSPTHELKFPFTIPGIGLSRFVRAAWPKHFSPRERELRAGMVTYEQMPVRALTLSRQLHDLVEWRAGAITQPILCLYADNERFGSVRGNAQFLNQCASRDTLVHFVNLHGHNLFYSDMREHTVNAIFAFLRNNELVTSASSAVLYYEYASAVVPAYNEADRIGAVLMALQAAERVGEIIVVDDGSEDDTEAVVRQFPNVRYLRNEENVGKGASMDRGVREAKFETIFFCDADLEGFEGAHADAIILPVLQGVFDMYVGLRGNFLQRMVKLWALNTGERALSKRVWERIPSYCKHRFRVETGLNYFVWRYTRRGLGWTTFPYTNPVKESKYGALHGTLLRWWMNFDVASTYALLLVMDVFTRRKTLPLEASRE